MDAAQCVNIGCGCPGTIHDPSCPFSMQPFYSPTVIPASPVIEPWQPSPGVFDWPGVNETNWHFTIGAPMTPEQRVRKLADECEAVLELHYYHDDVRGDVPAGWLIKLGHCRVVGQESVEQAFETLLEILLRRGVTAAG